MKDYEAVGDSGESDSQQRRPGESAGATQPSPEVAPLSDRQARYVCVVCGRLLGRDERKVHRGECAKKREAEMQTRRRQRTRIARGQ